mmetsp:Transcript_12076/g.19617  ORF Transcript_12076/g.19617 Transcript_12076/m.19617 type:complete len:345 (-) Transcript_12076:99-1133(-)
MIWDPSDANPLHRRLPAEVVSRRTRDVVKKGPTLPKEREEDVVVDQKTAVTLKPDARPKWLSKACRMTLEGKASATELYNIVVSRRFSSGLPERIARKLAAIVQKNLTLFSDKQRRHLSSNEFHLNGHMLAASAGEIDPEDADVDDAPKEEVELSASEVLAKEALLDSKRRQAELLATQEADRAARLVEEAAKSKRREAERREERKAFQFDGDAVSRHVAEKQAAQKRKLEEEADALLERALVPVPRERDDDKDRGRGRSRSIEARSESPPRRRRTEWRDRNPVALTGSRAILLNRDFQEDLPHLPRPNQGGGGSSQQSGSRSFLALADEKRSRSRARSRRRRR